MDINLLNFEIFDEDFYRNNYLKFKNIKSKKDLFLHWLNFGKDENLVLNKKQLTERYKLNLNYSNKLIKVLKFKENPDVIFNILIRTSERPEYFKKCMESIKKQNFKGKVNVYVCYDSLETLKYVKEYEGINLVFKENDKKYYSFNLYCNLLLKEVEEGWIIFLDDDDMFITENTLSIISSRIEDEDDLIIWEFLRPDKIISPQSNFKLGEIDTTCFCFNNKNKEKSEWISDRCSDFHFFKKLDDNNDFNKKFLYVPLVKTIYNDIIANYGSN